MMQDDTLMGDVASVDKATRENLENLVKVGEALLQKPVSKVNLDSGVFEPLNQGSNEEALKRYLFRWLPNSIYQRIPSDTIDFFHR